MTAHPKRASLLVAVSAAALSCAAPAAAQWIVSDPAHTALSASSLIETATQTAHWVKSLANDDIGIVQDVKKLAELVRTADAVLHGNYYAVAGLIPELQALGLVDPWNEDAVALQDMFTGASDLLAAASTIGREAAAMRNRFQFYRPAGAHYGARSLNGMANASAVQMAAANRMMTAAQDRARRINGLTGRIGTASDVTDAANAGARVGLETATNTAQSNMILSAMANQQVHRDIREVQARAAWYASVDQLRADAEAAYANARAGQVNFQTGTGIRVVNYAAPEDGSDAAGATALVSDSAGNVTYASGSTNASGLMGSREWGGVAAQAAAARGIRPEALSSLCAIESNCTDVGRRATGTIEGPWQMTAATFTAAAARAGVSGSNSDPNAQAYAAAEELRMIGVRLQGAGIEPTELNVRPGYQWGAAYAIALNTASPDTPMSSVLSTYSAETLRANGVTGMTVGQWRAGVASRLGADANRSIFPGTVT